ncbi:hypothetical protein VN12_02280 [Pirellula sp. SH-Sr6A]|uniref:hypothetical protein n=1 Tax=Pirellula sp. SH-Sr6A TaxID=1632865 RepID=UPI00078E85DE|nr:hypothetical protein [Pirellula sp. SH-Sr6A]AMV30914.1 hypothetical protein VN12_02280 [Pirellula sp. SH-Sr6A]
MASESVKILIEAEDQASAKIAATSKAIEANVKNIKDVGGKAKASTEFIGQLANQLGGTQFASFAGQFAGLTEKVSQFAEVSKLGGAGALAFKAGLVGLVGVLSFNLGKTIGDWWFETDRWNKELEDAIANSRRLNQELISLSQVRFGEQVSDIEKLGDTESQIESIDILIESLKKQQLQTNRNTADMQKQRNALTATQDEMWIGGLGFELAVEKERNALEEQIKLNGELSDSYRKQFMELEARRGKIVENAKAQELLAEAQKNKSDLAFIESLQRENNILAAQGDTVFELRAEYAGLTNDLAKRAVALMKEAEAEKKRQEAARKAIEQKRQDEEREKSNRKKVIDLLASENAALQERFVAITKGTEAAKVFNLQQKGISEWNAKRLAAREAELDRMEEEKRNRERLNSPTGPLQTTEMRLITRGDGDLQQQVANSTKAAEMHLAFIARLTAEREAREARAPRPSKTQDIRFREVSQ